MDQASASGFCPEVSTCSGLKDIEGMVYGTIMNQMEISAFVTIAILTNFFLELIRIDNFSKTFMLAIFKHPIRMGLITAVTIGLFVITRLYIILVFNLYEKFQIF